MSHVTERNYSEEIIKYLKSHPDPWERRQRAILDSLKMSQATFNRYIERLIGSGRVTFRQFGMAKIYELIHV